MRIFGGRTEGPSNRFWRPSPDRTFTPGLKTRPPEEDPRPSQRAGRARYGPCQSQMGMGRPHRLSVTGRSGGYRHFLTICTHDRQPHFADPSAAALTLDQFLHTARVEGFEILAYCFMPDHFHALVEGQVEEADLHRFVRLAKQRAGFRFSRARHQRLWQASFFDRTLRRERELDEVIAYVVNNPVRAGLVDDPAAYALWGSQTYTRDEILEIVEAERVRRGGRTEGPANRFWRPGL